MAPSSLATSVTCARRAEKSARERTRAGLAAAAARGRTGGRRPVVTQEKLRRAQALIAKGLSVRDAAVRLRVGKTALYDALRPPAT